MHPFYLASSMAKPMDLPTTRAELHNFKYNRPESELANAQNEITNISDVEYYIKSPSTLFPEALKKEAEKVSIIDKNIWVRESTIVADQTTTYYKFMVLGYANRALNHFVLEQCTHQDLMNEIQNPL